MHGVSTSATRGEDLVTITMMCVDDSIAARLVGPGSVDNASCEKSTSSACTIRSPECSAEGHRRRKKRPGLTINERAEVKRLQREAVLRAAGQA